MSEENRVVKSGEVVGGGAGETRQEERAALLQWTSPSRLFKKRGPDYFSRVGFTALGVGLVLIFFKEFLLLGVVLSLAFVAYVLGTVPPEKIGHKITSYGLTTAGHSYPWKELSDFWFTEKEGTAIVHISTNLRFPARLTLLLPASKRGAVEKLLSRHLSYREAPKESWLEKASDWAAGQLNLH